MSGRLKMDRDRAIALLREAQRSGTFEMCHVEADTVLCELLCALGYGDVVEEWRRVPKRYSQPTMACLKEPRPARRHQSRTGPLGAP